MNITINKFDSTHTSIAYAAIEYIGNKLLSKKLLKNIEITVLPMSKEDVDAGFSGMCTWEDNYICPREFTILLNKEADIGSFVETIAHEMIHIKQFAKGELKQRFYPSKKTLWMNVQVPDDMEYKNYPWEIEAFGKQYEYALEFVNYYVEKMK